ncbi:MULTISPECIES: hypothetical protein [Halomicrobium]|uniref:DUF3784 domain-containing protein n=2 Tax=Halomicrobium mukohataei TaxID=57705 RepID=C7P0S3_HALMD|nr:MULTISPECIES: hypothetical protein [Halomicrobium]ACV47055.1 hypothetical protein Hmuk_0926 [Halomicrobium mukohataei DSM 12286]QCD65544.1 hypothetical protein E5139_07795 [Halomicrobium mukohataei]QFR20350.1 hypothetical protein GBQ70_07790 [Halomicrobium sp. ZPS1]
MAAGTVTVVGSALLILALGVLIRFGRVTTLIAGVGPDDSPDPSVVDLVGTYTILVGLATGAMAVLTWTGDAGDRLWIAYTAAIVASAVVLVGWVNRAHRGIGG